MDDLTCSLARPKPKFQERKACVRARAAAMFVHENSAVETNICSFACYVRLIPSNMVSALQMFIFHGEKLNATQGRQRKLARWKHHQSSLELSQCQSAIEGK